MSVITITLDDLNAWFPDKPFTAETWDEFCDCWYEFLDLPAAFAEFIEEERKNIPFI